MYQNVRTSYLYVLNDSIRLLLLHADYPGHAIDGTATRSAADDDGHPVDDLLGSLAGLQPDHRGAVSGQRKLRRLLSASELAGRDVRVRAGDDAGGRGHPRATGDPRPAHPAAGRS